MQALALIVSQLGLGGGLLFGLPLVLMGLTMRGLSRRHLGRLLDARERKRRLTELSYAGRVALTGHARLVDDGRVALEDPRGARVLIEPPADVRLRDGEPLVVYGDAVELVGRAAAYREAARSWLVDARGEDHFVLTGVSLPGAIRRLRAQAVSGAVAFGIGVLLIAGGSLATLLTG
jgi:hypothetical protein